LRFRVSSDKLLCFTLIFFSIVKLWLVDAQNLTAICNAEHDDRLFLNIAGSLLAGQWLGPFNDLTLAKGPFYPIWIAAVYKTGMPLLLSQNLLYIGACAIFVISAKPLLHDRVIILLTYMVLLFNPMSYTNGVTTQVMREGIYPALTVLVISGAIGLMTGYNRRLLNITFWAIGEGLFLSVFWLTREEGIWIMPSVLIMIGYAIVKIYGTKPVNWKRISLYALPFVICLIIIGSVALTNKIYYGIYSTSEFKSPEFLSAHGSLLRVKHTGWTPTNYVPKDVREHIYKYSPAFSELKLFLEGDIGKGWIGIYKTVKERYHGSPEFAKRVNFFLDNDPSGIWERILFDESDDFQGGNFTWAFRDAVAAAGYYISGETVKNYYKRLATEVNAACADGRLECSAKRASLLPPWQTEYTHPFLKTVIHGAIFMIQFKGFDSDPVPSYGDEKLLKLFRDLTQERLSPPSGFRVKGVSFSERDSLPNIDKSKIIILNWINMVYQFALPFLTIIAVSFYIFSTFKIFKNRVIPVLWIITTSIIIAIVVRLIILSVIHVTSFPGIAVRYLSPSYPLLLIFVAMSLVNSTSDFIYGLFILFKKGKNASINFKIYCFLKSFLSADNKIKTTLTA
jgi:hypothetical protein